eukprot:3136934-Alexandrium_andersonii.AAC.1
MHWVPALVPELPCDKCARTCVLTRPHTHALRALVLIQVPARSNSTTGVRVPARPPVRAYR